MLMEQAINVYMAINSTYAIYALYQTDRTTLHKLISLLSFSVVNKTVHNNRAAAYCDSKGSRAANGWIGYLYAWKTSGPTRSKGDKSQTVCVPGRAAVLPRSSAKWRSAQSVALSASLMKCNYPVYYDSMPLEGPRVTPTSRAVFFILGQSRGASHY